MSFLSFLCIEMAVARRLCLAQRGRGKSRGSDRTWSSLCGAQRTSADVADPSGLSTGFTPKKALSSQNRDDKC